VNSRLVTILNAIGCLVLAGFILVQWQLSQKVSDQLLASRSREILQANARVEAENLTRQLQADIDGLKASVDSIQQSAALAEHQLNAKAEETKSLATQLSETQEQLRTWEAAVKSRDEALTLRDTKLQQLNDSLLATRKRLDQAVAELKTAGAR